MIGSYSSSKGGVTVDVELVEVSDIPAVEEVTIQAGEYILALTERKDIEYSDYTLTLDQFELMVDNLNKLLERIKANADN
jgi:hypothetical protein